MPNAFVILFDLLLLAAIATYIIPAGIFERESSAGHYAIYYTTRPYLGFHWRCVY